MMSVSKDKFRHRALVRRTALTGDARGATEAAVLSALRPWTSRPGPVAAYASQGAEPGTRSLLQVAEHVLLPVLLADGDLDWARYEGELVPGLRGTVEPPGPRLGRDAVADCALVVVPALAVDRFGTRLGRGGGSYDRALVRATGWLVAALHPRELAEHLPVEPHDVAVHAAVVCGRGLVRMRPHPLDGVGLAPGVMDG